MPPDLKEPKEWGFHYDENDLMAFYWDWVASNRLLTLTGSWLEDRRRFPQWRADLDVIDLLMSIQRQKVEHTVGEVRPGKG